MNSTVKAVCTVLSLTLVVGYWAYLSVSLPTIHWGYEVKGLSLVLLVLIVIAAGLALLGQWGQLTPMRLLLIGLLAAFDGLFPGFFVRFEPPLYIDTLGAVIIAIVVGPNAGAATALIASVIALPFGTASLLFATGNAVVAWCAGLTANMGGFQRWWKAIVTGVLIGALSSLYFAPLQYVAATSFEGFDPYTYSFVAQLRNNLFGAAVGSSVPSDILDKAVVFLAVYVIISHAPVGLRRFFQVGRAKTLPPEQLAM
ncbi:hypothetical protein QVA66_06610 [Staphylococcus chromogenes]|nr:hypothetical protein [Staphylococcus chromogenes]